MSIGKDGKKHYDYAMRSLKRLLSFLVFLVLVLSVTGTIFFMHIGRMRSREALETRPVREAAQVYLECGSCLAFEEIDTDLVHAVTSIEDKRFFERTGFDWVALIRAVINNFKAGRMVEGGSTITQQIAKNLYYADIPRGFDEKLAEVFLMAELESIYTKKQLFAVYVNMNYYGDGYWGLKQAAAGYYQKAADDLTPAEAAMLAGIPNAPALYQLSTGHDRALARQRRILQAMRKNKYISEEEYQAALEEDV